MFADFRVLDLYYFSVLGAPLTRKWILWSSSEFWSETVTKKGVTITLVLRQVGGCETLFIVCDQVLQFLPTDKVDAGELLTVRAIDHAEVVPRHLASTDSNFGFAAVFDCVLTIRAIYRDTRSGNGVQRHYDDQRNKRDQFHNSSSQHILYVMTGFPGP
jgi:hypothetical protein